MSSDNYNVYCDKTESAPRELKLTKKYVNKLQFFHNIAIQNFIKHCSKIRSKERPKLATFNIKIIELAWLYTHSRNISKILRLKLLDKPFAMG